MLWDNLTLAEAEFTKHALEMLKGLAWAQPLIKNISDAGGIIQQNMPFLFEARIAYALHRRGVNVQYEYPTGVGSSSVDFHVVSNGHNWLIEIVKIGESVAATDATRHDGPYTTRVLKTPSAGATAAESKQSPEGELLLVEQKIAEKVMRGRKPIKFPEPATELHMIIIDTRAFLNGGDADDYAQIAYGRDGMRHQGNILKWPNPKTGKWEPIKGLFQPENPLRGARLIQERIHFLGFVAEKTYEDEEIPRLTVPCANPHLISNEQAVRTAWGTNPLSAGFHNICASGNN
jgi:hypothetical protein